jgi:hypothetical protein
MQLILQVSCFPDLQTLPGTLFDVMPQVDACCWAMGLYGTGAPPSLDSSTSHEASIDGWNQGACYSFLYALDDVGKVKAGTIADTATCQQKCSIELLLQLSS